MYFNKYFDFYVFKYTFCIFFEVFKYNGILNINLFASYTFFDVLYAFQVLYPAYISRYYITPLFYPLSTILNYNC